MTPPRSPLHLSLFGVALALAVPAHAADAPADPTRPPAALSAPVVAAGAASSVLRAAAAAPVPAAPPRVQSVQVPQQGRANALVDNRLVFVGDKLGAATVIAIDTQGVQVRSAKGAVERLLLLDAQMTQHAVLPAGSSPAPMASLAGGKQP
ncbi:hypothetical protein [Ideonella sp. BN130291]|uniref:hypothetical protein n=1 Tax=Ideonella sp. BN130291 TaxID=3112940 RepID=UPI002E269181|nr:hypothetical protein [Ideonella sp. BN130291]